MKIIGPHATIELTNTHISLAYKNSVANFFSIRGGGGTQKQIPISSITAVNYKPASFGVQGFLQFKVAGDSVLNDSQNTFQFKGKQTKEVEALKAKIESKMGKAA